MIWKLSDGISDTEVEDVSDLLTALDMKNREDLTHPIMSLSNNADSGLYIGLGGDVGFLRFEASEREGYASVGDVSAMGAGALFAIGGSESEIRRRNLLPIAAVLEAAVEYYKTGARPKNVNWERD